MAGEFREIQAKGGMSTKPFGLLFLLLEVRCLMAEVGVFLFIDTLHYFLNFLFS
jgi:hypothetical protein